LSTLSTTTTSTLTTTTIEEEINKIKCLKYYGTKETIEKLELFHKLNDEYKIIGIIGYGGYSIVLHVYDINIKQHFAMKILQFEDYKQNTELSCLELIKQGKLEAERMKSICNKSKYITFVYNCFTKEILSFYCIYIIMELCNNGSLNDIIKLKREKIKLLENEKEKLEKDKKDKEKIKIIEEKENNIYFNENEIILYINNIANGLKIIHENNIFHRDIKPDNILLNSNNKYDIIKISDFGISSLQNRNNDSLTSGKGTMEYMAPEQISNNYDKSVDIWSFGITIYEIITLKKPLPCYGSIKSINDSLNKMKYNIPLLYHKNNKLIELIFKMLSINPIQRPTPLQIIDEIKVIFFLFYFFVQVDNNILLGNGT